MGPGKSSLLEALLLPWVSLETTFGALKVFVGLGRVGASLQGCSARQAGTIHPIISAALSPRGSTPGVLAEPGVALLYSSSLLLLYSGLVHP